MAPLVAPGVCRYTIESALESGVVVNILDMWIDDESLTGTREDAILDQAHIIFEQWADQVIPALVNDLTLNRVRWVDLNSLTGSTGEVTDGGAFTAPVAGGSSGDPLPANVSMLVTKVAPGGGRSTRSGRWYIAGLSEGSTDGANGNLIGSSLLTEWAGIWEDFLAAVNQDGSYDSRMVVVHTQTIGDADPVYLSKSIITDLAPQQLLATQRRRLRR